MRLSHVSNVSMYGLNVIEISQEGEFDIMLLLVVPGKSRETLQSE